MIAGFLWALSYTLGLFACGVVGCIFGMLWGDVIRGRE